MLTRPPRDVLGGGVRRPVFDLASLVVQVVSQCHLLVRLALMGITLCGIVVGALGLEARIQISIRLVDTVIAPLCDACVLQSALSLRLKSLFDTGWDLLLDQVAEGGQVLCHGDAGLG